VYTCTCATWRVNSNLKVFSISFISLHLTGSEPSIDQKKKKDSSTI
jgi:hypothetical protein